MSLVPEVWPFLYLGQYPPLRAGECRLPHCLNIAVVSSGAAAEARCCQTSDDRRQEQSPETGPLATQSTPTVQGLEHTNRAGAGGTRTFIKSNRKNHSLHLFINNLLFTYSINHKHWKLLCDYKKMVMSAARVAAARLGGARATGDPLHRSELQ